MSIASWDGGIILLSNSKMMRSEQDDELSDASASLSTGGDPSANSGQ